ncbi:hypothetical protein BPO_1960 [Bergeyella porcorum]|uniref:Uncharacterized protein n=1 Tax=Bergeyella porcorum TaxID=1735111 RepID=A0AAU0F3B7_9FLAO
MYLINISKKSKYIFSIILVILIGVGYYISVYKSYKYQSNNDTIGGIFILLGLFFLYFFWFRWREKKSFILLGVISIFTIIFLFIQRINYIDKELNKHGVIVKAVVIDFETDRYSRKKREYATFKYQFQNKVYIQRVEYFEKDEYRLHQWFDVKISKNKPEIFDIPK